MKTINLPGAQPSPQPAQAPIGEQTMRQTPHYTNGASPMHPPEQKRYFVIGEKLAIIIGGAIVSTVIGGGWFLSPAKDRDLQDVKKDVAVIAATVGKIGEKVDKLVYETQAAKVEIVRLQGSPAAPIIRARTAKPKPKPEKSTGIFGSLGAN